VLLVDATSQEVNVVVRLRIGHSNENWRTEPWVYVKAIKWFEDENDAIAEAERLNSLHDDPLYVYFVSHPKSGNES
jgi:hypothetical protein